MLPPVRRQYPEHIGINRMPIFLQFPDPARHPVYVVQDHHIGDEVIVLDDLALFTPDVFGDCAVTAEHQPLRVDGVILPALIETATRIMSG